MLLKIRKTCFIIPIEMIVAFISDELKLCNYFNNFKITTLNSNGPNCSTKFNYNLIRRSILIGYLNGFGERRINNKNYNY